MSTWATIHNDVATEVVTTNPNATFVPSVAAAFSIVPDGTQTGATLADGVWTNPAPAAPPVPVAVTVTYAPLTPMQFYMAFAPAERIAIKKSTDPIIEEFWATYQVAQATGSTIDPSLTSVVEALGYLATPTTATPPGPGILASASRIAQIQAGTAQ